MRVKAGPFSVFSSECRQQKQPGCTRVEATTQRMARASNSRLSGLTDMRNTMSCIFSLSVAGIHSAWRDSALCLSRGTSLMRLRRPYHPLQY